MTDGDELAASDRTVGFGWRHVLVILASFGIAEVYIMRSNLSVALLAMVNDTSTDNETLQNTCPENIPAYGNTSNHGVTSGEFQWSRELQGIILSSFFFGYFVSQIPGAQLAEIFGGKWVFAAGVGSTAIFTLFTPVVARIGPYSLIALRVAMGIGEGVTYPALTAVLGCWIPQSESTFLFTVAYSGGQLGTIIGQLMVGPLSTSSWGWTSVFYISGISALLWLVPWILLTTNEPGTHRFISTKECGFIQSSAAKGGSVSRRCCNFPWKKILTDRAVWAYTFCIFVNSWKFYTLLTCLPQFLSDVLHFDIKSNSIVSILPYVGNFLFQFFASWLADAVIRSGRFSRTHVRKIFTAIGLGSVTVFMILAVFTGCNVVATVVMLVVMLMIGAFDLGGFSPNPLDLSPEFCGTLTAIGNAFGITAGMISPIVTDSITRNHSRYEWSIVFYLTSAIAAAGIIVFTLFGSASRRHWRYQFDADELPIQGDEDEEFSSIT